MWILFKRNRLPNFFKSILLKSTIVFRFVVKTRHQGEKELNSQFSSNVLYERSFETLWDKIDTWNDRVSVNWKVKHFKIMQKPFSTASPTNQKTWTETINNFSDNDIFKFKKINSSSKNVLSKFILRLDKKKIDINIAL